MTLSEKAKAIARMFDEGREGDAYRAMEQMLQERGWPAWLRATVTMLQLDDKPEVYAGKGPSL